MFEAFAVRVWNPRAPAQHEQHHGDRGCYGDGGRHAQLVLPHKIQVSMHPLVTPSIPMGGRGCPASDQINRTSPEGEELNMRQSTLKFCQSVMIKPTFLKKLLTS